MRLTYLAYTFSLAVMYYSIVFLIPIIVALLCGEVQSIFPFLIAGSAAFFVAVTLRKVVPGVSEVKSVNDIKKSASDMKKRK